VKPFDGRLASLLALSRIHETGGVYPRGIQLHFESADGPKMEALDYWRLCDELNVIQAALLVVGCDPSGNEESIELYPDKSPPGYQAAKIAISNALCRKEIAGQIVPHLLTQGQLIVFELNDQMCVRGGGGFEGFF
jgi:hypothetical protein